MRGSGHSRRDFCRGAAAFALSGGMRLPLAAAAGTRRLRVGVLSDIHITKDSDAEHFVRALRVFDRERADAVLIAGDLTTNGVESELAAVARAWFGTFPDDRRSDGGRIERLFVTGNHDVDGCAYPGAGFRNAEEARPTGFYYNRERMWERHFREPYRTVSVKTVRGYAFVLRHWISILGHDDFKGKWPGFSDERSPLPELLPTFGLPADRPFFYVQHDQMDDTTNATWLLDGKRWKNGQDRGEARAVLRRYPNCLALSGHCHNSLTDEMSIWQGEFTAVNCSCMAGWEFTPPGRENGLSISDFGRRPPLEMPAVDFRSVRQGMIMDVYDDEIVFRRLDFLRDLSLGEDWRVPLFGGRTVPVSGTPKYDFRARAARAQAPQFPGNAALRVERTSHGHRREAAGIWPDKAECEQVTVTFPSVTVARGSPSRAYEFVVRCESRASAVDERRVFSPGVMQAESLEPAECACAFPGERIPADADVRFTVTPYDCWGNAGNPLSGDWVRVMRN